MASTTNACANVRKINRKEVQPLWYSDFWDVPINGLCLYRNRIYWFEMAAEEQEAAARRYLIVELSPQQVADEERWHELFREKVGTHTDFDEPRPEVKPKELHREFYDLYQNRSKPDYSENPVIGWFELS